MTSPYLHSNKFRVLDHHAALLCDRGPFSFPADPRRLLGFVKRDIAKKFRGILAMQGVSFHVNLATQVVVQDTQSNLLVSTEGQSFLLHTFPDPRSTYLLTAWDF